MFRNQLGKLQTLWAKCKILKVQGPLCTTLKVCGPNYKIETSRTRLKIYDRGILKVILLMRSLSSEFDRSFQTTLTNEGGIHTPICYCGFDRWIPKVLILQVQHLMSCTISRQGCILIQSDINGMDLDNGTVSTKAILYLWTTQGMYTSTYKFNEI